MKSPLLAIASSSVLTPAGSALFANEFITVINDRFGAALPLIGSLCYPR